MRPGIRQIAHDAAAQGEDKGFAFEAVRGQLVAHYLDHFEAFGSLAMRDANNCGSKPAEQSRPRPVWRRKAHAVVERTGNAGQVPAWRRTCQFGSKPAPHKWDSFDCPKER